MKDMLIEMQETPIMDPCSECRGTGTVEYEVARPQSFSRDIGEIDVEEKTCEACAGGGEVPRLCDCGEEVTKARLDGNVHYIINGRDFDKCEECANA
jgi:RecJ-like exonuclease